LPHLPGWVPKSARHYLSHTVGGQSLRALARQADCHASTILRQVRQFESRRDDWLVDQALNTLGGLTPDAARKTKTAPTSTKQEHAQMPAASRARPTSPNPPSDDEMQAESARILRRLNEPGACLAVAADMEQAVVVREDANGKTIRTAVADRAEVEAMALTDWIACATPGRIARYHITPAGRAALREMLAKAESAQQGMAEAPAPFAAAVPGASAPPRRAGARYCAVESPLQLLARRRRRDGTPFLAADLVAAGERLREDFELAQYGPRIAQDWEAFLTGGSHPDPSGGSPGAGGAARDRVYEALGTLGPGLGDVVLRCCCFLEGMEEAEKHMGWSARSGKIVLRIALERLRDHYRAQSRSASLIG